MSNCHIHRSCSALTASRSSWDIKHRDKGNAKPQHIADIVRATGCVDSNLNGTCDKGDTQFKNVWIFNVPNLVSYFWDYTNTDLKLMQVRFYPVAGGCGTITTVQ